jgi:enamine deaminase RidA (YjgF/YER057c/UK114 family)
MEKRPVDPWTWQQRYGYSQAWRVDRPEALVFLAGQGPVSADGELVGGDDFEVQVRQTFENVRTVLEEAGASPSSLVKLTVYLTDIGRLRDFGRVRGEFLPGPPPASTAVEVTALALPGMMVEVEGVAVV